MTYSPARLSKFFQYAYVETEPRTSKTPVRSVLVACRARPGFGSLPKVKEDPEGLLLPLTETVAHLVVNPEGTIIPNTPFRYSVKVPQLPHTSIVSPKKLPASLETSLILDSPSVVATQPASLQACISRSLLLAVGLCLHHGLALAERLVFAQERATLETARGLYSVLRVIPDEVVFSSPCLMECIPDYEYFRSLFSFIHLPSSDKVLNAIALRSDRLRKTSRSFNLDF